MLTMSDALLELEAEEAANFLAIAGDAGKLLVRSHLEDKRPQLLIAARDRVEKARSESAQQAAESVRRGEMTLAQKADFIGQHGLEKYQALPE